LSLFFTAMLFYHFSNTGLDVAVCRMRVKTGMADAGRTVGGTYEKQVVPTGMTGDGVELMSVDRERAKTFPFGALGRRFENLYQERVQSWSDIKRLGMTAEL
jgi:hypothetical protein